jgi:hypothetical protein
MMGSVRALRGNEVKYAKRKKKKKKEEKKVQRVRRSVNEAEGED